MCNSTCSCQEALIKIKIKRFATEFSQPWSHLSTTHGWNGKLLRLWRLSGVVVDDTPSVSKCVRVCVNESVRACVCVSPFTASITGQGCMRNEAERQLVDRGPSLAGGYKVSPPKAYPRPPCRPLTLLLLGFIHNHICTRSKTTAKHANERCHVHGF